MIKNEEFSLLNKRLSNSDILNFCLYFEEKSIPYSCEVFVKDGPRYTYKYAKNIKEENPFKNDSFKNFEIATIKFKSKYCKLQYGYESENKIIFEGDENDKLYQYFFTKIESWKVGLVKLKRIKVVSTSDYFLVTTFSMLSIFIISFCYSLLSIIINDSRLSTTLSSIFLALGLFTATLLYLVAFPPYELNIGLCKYKKLQAAFYSIFSLCIVPILLGLFI